MYGGPDADVTFRCADHLAGVIIDRFGSGVMLIPDGEGYFKAHATVAVSPQFFGWVTGIGSGIEIVSPPEVRKQYKAYLREILKHY